jgi:hypothetical protein
VPWLYGCCKPWCQGVVLLSGQRIAVPGNMHLTGNHCQRQSRVVPDFWLYLHIAVIAMLVS